MLEKTLQTFSHFSIELIVVGLICFFIERVRPAEPDIHSIKADSRQEFLLALFNILITIPFATWAVIWLHSKTVAMLIPHQIFAPTLEALPIGIQMFLGAFLLDFSTYWRHRFTHKYMWPFHATHHSATHLNWLTSMRLHPVDVCTALLFDLTILYLIGFSGAGMACAVILIKAFNYINHMNLNLQFAKPARYILASPYFHRWHHATDKEAYDKNFCAMFSCIDLMFGTYHHPETGLPKAYGMSPWEQKNYPLPFMGQLLYPFARIAKKLKKRR